MKPSSFFILLIALRPALHSEALHIAVASGMKVIDTTDPAEIIRYYPRAGAILVEEEARSLLPPPPPRGGPPIYLVVGDPGPVPHHAVVACHADRGFVIPAQATDLLRALGEATRAGNTQDSSRGRVVGILGVVGGAGASTLALAVAREGARHQRTVLIDAVDHSGGLDLLAGCEDTPGARWPDLHVAEGTLAAEDVVAALPRQGEVAVLSAARGQVDEGYRLAEEELRGAVDTLRRGGYPVVLDIAGTGDLGLAGAEVCDEVVLLCCAEVRAGARLAGLAARLRARGIAASVVLRHRGWSGLDAQDIQRLSGLHVVAELPTIAGLAKAAELGGIPARLPRAVRGVAEAVWR